MGVRSFKPTVRVMIISYLAFYALTTHAIHYIDGIQIYSKDGTVISANAYLPQSILNASKKWPLIIMPNSWDLTEYEYAIVAKKLAQNGYIVLSYSARGWGKSGGKVSAGGADDLADIDAIITWGINELPIIRQKIAMAGISYGGGLSLLAAAHDSRIKVVVAMSSWSDLNEALYINKSPSIVWGNLLVNTGKVFGRLSPNIEQNYQHLLKHQSVSAAKKWANERSALSYIDEINKNKPAIFLSQNLEDRLFNANTILSFYNHLKTNKHLELNQGIHGSAEAPGLIGIGNYVWNQAFKWFDYWLKGDKQAFELSQSIRVEAVGNKRFTFSSWPTNLITKYYYLHQGKWLSCGILNGELAKSNTQDTLKFNHFTGVNSGLPIISPILQPYKHTPVTAWLPGINPSSAIYYKTKPLSQTKLILGTPRVTLWYQPTLEKSQFIAYLYDVDSLGVGRLISHAPVSHYYDIPGNYTITKFDLSMSAYKVPKGHSIALAIGMFDVLYQPPSSKPYTVNLVYGPQMASSIEIPFMK